MKFVKCVYRQWEGGGYISCLEHDQGTSSNAAENTSKSGEDGFGDNEGSWGAVGVCGCLGVTGFDVFLERTLLEIEITLFEFDVTFLKFKVPLFELKGTFAKSKRR